MGSVADTSQPHTQEITKNAQNDFRPLNHIGHLCCLLEFKLNYSQSFFRVTIYNIKCLYQIWSMVIEFVRVFFFILPIVTYNRLLPALIESSSTEYNILFCRYMVLG